jgi:putative membrane protein
VAGLASHYAYTGKMVSAAKQGQFPRSDRWLRVFNEVSVFGAIGVLWLVVVKPF